MRGYLGDRTREGAGVGVSREVGTRSAVLPGRRVGRWASPLRGVGCAVGVGRRTRVLQERRVGGGPSSLGGTIGVAPGTGGRGVAPVRGVRRHSVRRVLPRSPGERRGRGSVGATAWAVVVAPPGPGGERPKVSLSLGGRSASGHGAAVHVNEGTRRGDAIAVVVAVASSAHFKPGGGARGVQGDHFAGRVGGSQRRVGLVEREGRG